MSTSTACILVIIIFFALLFYSVHLEEKRIAERRRLDLPHPEERRERDRRLGQSHLANLQWAIRGRWSKWAGAGKRFR